MKSLFPDHVDLTAKVMDFQLQRQNIVSANLANINTPGYKARRLEFEKDLQAALGISESGAVTRTHPDHFPVAGSPESMEASVTRRRTSSRPEGPGRLPPGQSGAVLRQKLSISRPTTDFAVASLSSSGRMIR